MSCPGRVDPRSVVEESKSAVKPKVPWARCKKSLEVGLASIDGEFIPVAAGSVGVEYFLFLFLCETSPILLASKLYSALTSYL